MRFSGPPPLEVFDIWILNLLLDLFLLIVALGMVLAATVLSLRLVDYIMQGVRYEEVEMGK